nr:hypothetical protein [Saprospiraceae bacterium]
MRVKSTITLKNLISRFPEIDLPVTLTEDSEREFSIRHPPLPMPLVEKFFGGFFPKSHLDEFTEFIPCFRLKDTKGFHALILWVAELTKKQFYLITLNNDGKGLHSKIIGGTVLVGNKILRTAARLDEDWMIYTVSGVSEGELVDLDHRETFSAVIELMPDGSILQNQ